MRRDKPIPTEQRGLPRGNAWRVLGCALALLALVCEPHDPSQLSVTGLIEGGTAEVGSLTGGRVADIAVREGEPVAEGDLLLQLEADEAEAAVEAAEAQLAQAEAALRKARTGARPEQLAQAEAAAEAAEAQYELAVEGTRREEIEGARAALEAAESQRDDAQSEYRRAERLLEQEVIPERDYEQAKHRYEGAEAQVRQAREKLSGLESGSRAQELRAARAQYEKAQAALEELREGTREEDVESAEAAVSAAHADLRKAERGLRETRIHAPGDAVVESLDLRKGDLVSPGPVARLVDAEDLTLTVYVSALALGHLQAGQTVTLTTDSHGDTEFEGTLAYLASQGEFTPRNLQTEEERAQQVFGVKIRTHSHDGKLKAGMTATAHFDLEGEEIAWEP